MNNNVVYIGTNKTEEKKADWVTNEKTGAIEAGTDVNGLASMELWKMATRKYIPCNATVTYSQNNSIVENKTSFNLDISVSGLTAGDGTPTKVELFRDGALVESKEITDISLTIDFTTISTIDANTTFSIKLTDSNNKVNEVSNKKYTFINATFYGVVENDATLDDTVITALTKTIKTKGNVTYPFSTNGFKTVVFASEWQVKSIINQNNYEVLSSFVESRVTINDVDYYVYSLSNVNITNFKYTFKY